jgi:hypothetical protein
VHPVVRRPIGAGIVSGTISGWTLFLAVATEKHGRDNYSKTLIRPRFPVFQLESAISTVGPPTRVTFSRRVYPKAMKHTIVLGLEIGETTPEDLRT